MVHKDTGKLLAHGGLNGTFRRFYYFRFVSAFLFTCINKFDGFIGREAANRDKERTERTGCRDGGCGMTKSIFQSGFIVLRPDVHHLN